MKPDHGMMTFVWMTTSLAFVTSDISYVCMVVKQLVSPVHYPAGDLSHVHVETLIFAEACH